MKCDFFTFFYSDTLFASFPLGWVPRCFNIVRVGRIEGKLLFSLYSLYSIMLVFLSV